MLSRSTQAYRVIDIGLEKLQLGVLAFVDGHPVLGCSRKQDLARRRAMVELHAVDALAVVFLYLRKQCTTRP